MYMYNIMVPTTKLSFLRLCQVDNAHKHMHELHMHAEPINFVSVQKA